MKNLPPCKFIVDLVIDDLRDIWRWAKYNKVANQKIHRVSSEKLKQILTYKTERLGMQVILQELLHRFDLYIPEDQ